MKRLVTAALAALSLLAMAGTASADTVEAHFRFNPQAPVETSYRAFERIAQRACRIQSGAGLAVRRAIEGDCSRRLIADAVSATGDATFVAYYAERTQRISAPLLAEAR